MGGAPVSPFYLTQTPKFTHSGHRISKPTPINMSYLARSLRSSRAPTARLLVSRTAVAPFHDTSIRRALSEADSHDDGRESKEKRTTCQWMRCRKWARRRQRRERLPAAARARTRLESSKRQGAEEGFPAAATVM